MFGRSHRQTKQAPVNYQAIRLSRGPHASPDEGACVMELASMLAGESFTDAPVSVCPVIACFLRPYNDSIDDDRRQGLYDYASRVVGSRAPEPVQWARADHMAAWALAIGQAQRTGIARRLHRRASARHQGTIGSIGRHAVRSIRRHTDDTHAAALALIDELLEIGARSSGSDLQTSGHERPRSQLAAPGRDSHTRRPPVGHPARTPA
jgi:hypothetical protein